MVKLVDSELIAATNFSRPNQKNRLDMIDMFKIHFYVDPENFIRKY